VKKGVLMRPFQQVEYLEGRKMLVRHYQRLHMSDVIEVLKKGRNLKKGHWCRKLHPFLDKDGIIKQHGRLRNALIAEDEKIRMIIPRSSLT
jgi:hypothetical protein